MADKKGLYYQKDKKANVYATETYVNDKGRRGTRLVDLFMFPIWCYTRQLTQGQIYAGQVYLFNETRMFVFNYYPQIKVGCIVEYKESKYEITRVDTADDYNGELFAYVKDYNG